MKLFIGCSSRTSIPEKYINDSKEYLEKLFSLSNDLVFGAYNNGLMGLSYEMCKKNNGKVIGICPKAYEDDFENLDCDTEITTVSVSNRTDKLIEESDALIFLPGGIGTIYEFFAALEFKRCHEFDKPIIIYNSCGFFDKMFELLEITYKENFTPREFSDLYYVSSSARDTLNYIENYYKNKSIKKLGK